MTLTASRAPESPGSSGGDRFRLHRAGILNVWQYDDQEFRLADGRMLLRGANGAGKSKTLEMLLPFALDGDKARITASARHHTSLLWLMTDGYEGQARVGYIWVEFLRRTGDGQTESFSCGVGIRASASARTATAWFFTTSQRIGHDLHLEDDGGPMSRPRLEEAVGAHGKVFQQAAAYKEHVGRALFGLDAGQYDEVLRLLYWLRQPQVGEDIEPGRLADQLAQALPQLDEHAVKSAGDTFDELTAFGEQIERRAAAAEALSTLAAAYATYARRSVAVRGRAVVEALREERRLRGVVRRREREVAELTARRDSTESEVEQARRASEQDLGRIAELEASPEARDQRRLGDLAGIVEQQQLTATEAGERAERTAATLERRSADHATFTDDVADRVRGHARGVRDLDDRQRECATGANVAPPTVLEVERLDRPEQAEVLDEALGRTAEAMGETKVAVGHRRAAVAVVREALTRLEGARRRQQAAERAAEETERRWEEARERREAAQGLADVRAGELAQELAAWQARPDAPDVTVPLELTPSAVESLPGLARAAAAPGLARLRAAQQSAATARDNAHAAIVELTRTRGEIESERDPAPPPPALRRTTRPDGRSLWQLVDFAEHLTADARAGLEAALQDSGLLDAWLRSDGRLLDPDSRDVLLVAGAPLAGPTAADVLHADLPHDAQQAPDAAHIERVLRSIRLGASDDEAGDGAAREPGGVTASIDPEGRWRLGPLRGRAVKERAQFIGATARAQERQRRLAEIDATLDREQAALDDAVTAVAAHDASITALEEWVGAVPSADALRAAWTTIQERLEAELRDEKVNADAQATAHRARGEVAQVRGEVERLAARHDVPLVTERLDALDERLRGLDDDLRRAIEEVRPLRRDLARWARDRGDLMCEATALAEERREVNRLAGVAAESRARLSELRNSVGASVRQLEERLAALRVSRASHDEAAEQARTRLRQLERGLGTAEQAAAQAVEAVAGHAGRRDATLSGLAALIGVPGLRDAAFAAPELTSESEPDWRSLIGLADLPAAGAVPAVVLAVAEQLAGWATVDEVVDPSAVWRAYNEATSGPAADHEPTVATYGELLAVTGRDDAGECPITRLATRVGVAVKRDRELLTDRERQRFEEHILGELGDAIRRCRVEADELVTAMNALLAGVTTSQGIRVRLDWRLRDDVPPEARDAVRLLGQPTGALLPEERITLRDALHRLIEVSRAERPELAYGEHLAAALDYRGWFSFKIRYTRPESAGSWLELHRRSPLSQGEQKVLCYLPLFAAAAAHFSSLAGAAPHAPRLVLLDDAFPKIDVRTHPLLFGLLVQLDLDFVVTSERLWGDHDTVPSLAIYEALRDPMQRGIAQYEYRWDGRQLHSLG
jgi:uncharacterized protein (TIGR02680 family)